MELLELIDLEKLRLQMSFDGQLTLADEKQTLHSARIGEVAQTKPDEELRVSEILDLVNSPFAGLLDENDKVLRQILNAIFEDPDISDAFQAQNSYDILMNIIREKFDEKIALEVEKYYNFAEEMEKNKSFATTLMRHIFNILAERSTRNSNFTYDEKTLKERLYQAFELIFAPLIGQIPTARSN